MYFDQLKRREFITFLGGAGAMWPLAASAQQPEKNVCIGLLATLPLPPVQRFFRILQEYGYVEGGQGGRNGARASNARGLTTAVRGKQKRSHYFDAAGASV